MRQGRKRYLWLLMTLLLLFGLDRRLQVETYSLRSAKIHTPIRLALITDLHSCTYGREQRQLLDAIEAGEPDLILLGGDILDDRRSPEPVETLLEGLEGRYPCTYVTGNHEYWGGAEDFQSKMEILQRHGVTRLANDSVVVKVGDEEINLCGVNDPDANLVAGELPEEDGDVETAMEVVSHAQENGKLTVLLIHHPEMLELYARYGFDLVLAGHAHGGMWRIPGVLPGIWAPAQGLLPKITSGMYRQDDTTLIVSRGLAKESSALPRFYNRPELVFVDLLPQ